MRYQRLQDIVRLAVRFQGALGGLTLSDIEEEFGVSRRTAERLRDAVDSVFGPLELVDTDDTKRHWRLRSDALRRIVSLSAEELAELDTAAETLERAGFDERAAALRELGAKLRATLRTDTLARIESDHEALVHIEGLAMRAGPKPRLDQGLLALLRETITTRRVVEFRYLAQSTRRRSRQRVAPYGLLYGNRAFLVGKTDWSDEPRLWRLANMSEPRITDETYEPDSRFDLRRYAERSFGTFQEKPVHVVLRFDPAAARDASAFLFHPTQSIEDNPDGSVTVRFKAGGIDEMCWHLFTWGDSVTVEKPVRLRRRLAEMCEAMVAHHGDAGSDTGTICRDRMLREGRRDGDTLKQVPTFNRNGESKMTKVIYEGEATLGQQRKITLRRGRGKITYLDGTYAGYRYEGDFEENYQHGWGKLYDKDGNLEYEGQWSKGMYHGQGTLDYSHHDEPGRYHYEGEFVNDNEHGQGTCTYLDDYWGDYAGYRYEGDFRDGYEHGRGTLYDLDGNLEYEGQWSEGMYHGQGTLDYSHHDEPGRYHYEGEFVNDNEHGQGTCTYLDDYWGDYAGYRYEGDFRDGYEHGRGTLCDLDGNLVYEGEFTYGEPVDENAPPTE